MRKIIIRLKGGPGSGHHGHAGRPGKRGGSAPGKTAMYIGPLSSNSEREKRLEKMGFDRPYKTSFLSIETHKFLEDRISGAKVTFGEDESRRDSITGRAPRGLKVTKNGITLFAQGGIQANQIWISYLESDKPGSGLGKPFMEAMKQYANLTGMQFNIIKATNPGFYNHFDWLTRESEYDFVYKPWKAKTKSCKNCGSKRVLVRLL